MPSIRSLLLVTLPLWQYALAQDLSEPSPTTVVEEVKQTFEDVLHALPAQSLHAALHNLLHPKFQDGVYEDEHDALAQVHSEDPTLASKLLDAAKLELVKRQAGGSNTTTTSSGDDATTTTSAPPPPTSTTETTSSTSDAPTSSDDNGSSSAPPPPPPSSSTVAVVVPIETSSTDAQGSVGVSTTSAVASASVSIAVPVTTTDSQGQAVTSQSLAPGAVVTTTDAQGQSVETTSPVPTFQPEPSGVTSGQVSTTTDARGSSVVTTFGGGAVSSLVLETTTLSGGQRSTRTTFVSAVGTPTDDAGASDGTTSTKKPSLQNGAPPALGTGKGVLAVLGAVVLGAVAMI